MNTPLGPIFAFMSSVTWAIGSAEYSKYSSRFSAFRINYNRALIALPLFIFSVFIFSGGIQGGFTAFQTLRPEHLTWFAISVVASYSLGDAFFLWSTLSLGVPGALAIASSYPILNALFSVIVEGSNLALIQWLGLLVAVLGIVIVILNQPPRKTVIENPDAERKSHSKALGIGFAILTAVAWSVNSIAVSKAARDLDPSVGNTARMFFALVLCLVFGRLIGKEKLKPLPLSVLKTLGPIMALESFVGCYFFVYGLSRSNLVLASILTSLAPVISVPVTVALKLEAFSWKRALGVVIVVLGLALLVADH